MSKYGKYAIAAVSGLIGGVAIGTVNYSFGVSALDLFLWGGQTDHRSSGFR